MLFQREFKVREAHVNASTCESSKLPSVIAGLGSRPGRYDPGARSPFSLVLRSMGSQLFFIRAGSDLKAIEHG